MRIIARKQLRLQVFFQALQLGFQHPAVGEFKEADAFRCSARQHGPQRSLYPGYRYNGPVLTLAGGKAGNFFESFSKATEGIIAILKSGMRYLFSVFDLPKGLIEALHSLESLESHPMVLLEPAADPAGVQPSEL